MEKEIIRQLEEINDELRALCDTFDGLDIACNDTAIPLPKRALWIPTKCLCKLSEMLNEITEKL